MTLATVQTSVGYVILFIVFLLCVVFGLATMRKGKGAVGAEVATAPNRKPYYDDKTLETKRLDRVLTMAFLALAFVSLALPLYWLREPGRQASAVAGQDATFLQHRRRALREQHAGEPQGPRLRGLPRRRQGRRGRRRRTPSPTAPAASSSR